jgi:hypothetical protein
MSPKIPASSTPHEATTATLPCGISSIAYRVDRFEESEAGIARSSLPGTKRMVNAGPAIRRVFGSSKFAPLIQTLRNPLFRRTIVRVAVESRQSAEMSFSIISNAWAPGGRLSDACN